MKDLSAHPTATNSRITSSEMQEAAARRKKKTTRPPKKQNRNILKTSYLNFSSFPLLWVLSADC
jgi:hypothetical protein